MAPAAPMTAEDLLHLNLQETRAELVGGVLVVREPAGLRHGDVAMQLGAAVAVHAREHGLGRTFAAETGFTLRRNPDTVRAADVAFIANARLPERDTRGFAEVAPDLAIEVLSPDDRPGEVLSQVADWLSAGCRLVWVIDPVREEGRVDRGDGTQTLLSASDVLDGEDVLPGFTCPLAAILR